MKKYSFQKLFEMGTEVIGWLQIMASPSLIGLGLGSLIYFSEPTTLRLWIGILVALAGLITGMVWASKRWKGKGTIWFMSRIMATPELDVDDENNEHHKKH